MKENSEGMKNMSVEIKTDEDVVTAFLSGEIDHHVALPIREKQTRQLFRHTLKESCLIFRESHLWTAPE